jgi:hypothetical protein
MHRRLTLLTVAALTVALLYPIPASGRADPTRAEAWRAIAHRALDRVDTLTATGTHRASTLGYAAQATAWLSPVGWQDPAAQVYLNRLYATRNPDGGWGLGFEYDAHGDGTCAPPTPTSCNSAATTYVVTLADHVGKPLLDAARAGVVPRSDVQQVIDLIATAPRIDTAAGRCIAYSRNANDAKAGLCVHNVSAGAAAFFLEAGADGFAVPWWLVAGISKRTASVYNLSTRFTPYRDNMAPASDDPDHASYTAESMLRLDPSIGYVAAYHLMLNDFTYAQTPIAHMRLTSATVVPSGASWCVLGDRWLAEADAYTTEVTGDVGRLSQIAYYASRAARACA